jgi:hypothetical protein
LVTHAPRARGRNFLADDPSLKITRGTSVTIAVDSEQEDTISMLDVAFGGEELPLRTAFAFFATLPTPDDGGYVVVGHRFSVNAEKPQETFNGSKRCWPIGVRRKQVGMASAGRQPPVLTPQKWDKGCAWMRAAELQTKTTRMHESKIS